MVGKDLIESIRLLARAMREEGIHHVRFTELEVTLSDRPKLSPVDPNLLLPHAGVVYDGETDEERAAREADELEKLTFHSSG